MLLLRLKSISLHVICHGYCAILLFEIQDGGQVLWTVSKCKAFPSRFVFENVGNKTISTTNIVECKDLSTIIKLEFMS